jgi:hypothetical protein
MRNRNPLQHRPCYRQSAYPSLSRNLAVIDMITFILALMYFVATPPRPFAQTLSRALLTPSLSYVSRLGPHISLRYFTAQVTHGLTSGITLGLFDPSYSGLFS